MHPRSTYGKARTTDPFNRFQYKLFRAALDGEGPLLPLSRHVHRTELRCTEGKLSCIYYRLALRLDGTAGINRRQPNQNSKLPWWGITGGQASPQAVALGCCERRTGSGACRRKEYTLGPHSSRIQPPGSASSGSPCPQRPYLKVLRFPLCGPFRGAWPTMRSRLHPARHRTSVGQRSREMDGLILDA
jgi:hypothetical protein